MTTLVLGVGHPDRGDDAVGLLVAERLRQTPGVVVRCEAGDASGILTDPVWDEAERVVLIDSIRTGAPAGTVACWEIDELLGGLVSSPPLTHELGVATTIQLADALGRLPHRLTLVGIEGADLSPGSPITPSVRSAVAIAAGVVLRLISPATRTDR